MNWYRCCLIVIAVHGLPQASQADPSAPIVIAHRGASGYLPEHTLAAKALAYGMGADYLEQDVVLTRDGHPIVLHDIYLDRVTDVDKKFPGRARADGRYYAIDFSLAEIKQLRVHERFDNQADQQVFRDRFPADESLFQVPTLAEELHLVRGMNRTMKRHVGIYPEIKAPAWHREQGQDISSIVLDILKQFGYTNKSHRAYLQCFDAAELRRIREDLGSELKLVQLLKSDCDSEPYSREGMRAIAAYADGIGPPISCVVASEDGKSPEVTPVVELAHQCGLVVHPYTFRADAIPDYAEDFQNLHNIFFEQAAVDGIFTDFPDQSVAARVRLAGEH